MQYNKIQSLKWLFENSFPVFARTVFLLRGRGNTKGEDHPAPQGVGVLSPFVRFLSKSFFSDEKKDGIKNYFL